ncbi:MAG: AEC family transporter [Planctomycetota bacterium]|jgi:predicted permease
MELKVIIPLLLTAPPLAVGYLAQRRGWASEILAQRLMTAVVVVGYPLGGFFSIWGMELHVEDLWLPTLGALQVGLMAAAGTAIGRAIAADKAETGLISIASALGNTGFTMGGLVLYLLHGKQGLGLVAIYCLMWMPAIVLVTYPIARHYAPNQPRRPLWRLIVRSIFDWRSVGLPISLAAIWLSMRGVMPPEAFLRFRVVDIIIFLVAITAFFSIGLRLRLKEAGAVKKLIATVTAARFGLGLAVGWSLASATLLTPWALRGIARDVFVVEAFVPTAVTTVGVANMFNLRPRAASAVFVVNTLVYLVAVLPVVIWIFG